MTLERQAAGIGTLADPVRRALYEYVVAQPDAVGREEAAAAVDVAPHKAKFHLDRLVEQGLLDVEFRRLTGRTGPGAGRPAKLYRRSAHEWSVSLPPRRYDLAGHLLAVGVERLRAQAGSVDEALSGAARDEGVALGAAAQSHPGSPSFVEVLASQGYEPTEDGEQVSLSNCPFDALAREHTELVCGLNCSFVQGIADGLGRADLEARLEPDPSRCCVVVGAGR